MSDYDDMDLDEINELYEDPDEVSPEDVFSMVMINKIKGTKVRVELKDEKGDDVNISEIIEELLSYMKDKISGEENNDFNSKIMPLMTQSLVSGLGRLIGIQGTGMVLSSDMLRFSLVQMMSMSLLLLKFIQDNDLKIYTCEEEVTQEELDEIEKTNKVTKAAMLGHMLGLDAKEILEEMRKRGMITKEDLMKILGDDDDNIN